MFLCTRRRSNEVSVVPTKFKSATNDFDTNVKGIPGLTTTLLIKIYVSSNNILDTSMISSHSFICQYPCLIWRSLNAIERMRLLHIIHFYDNIKLSQFILMPTVEYCKYYGECAFITKLCQYQLVYIMILLVYQSRFYLLILNCVIKVCRHANEL